MASTVTDLVDLESQADAVHLRIGDPPSTPLDLQLSITSLELLFQAIKYAKEENDRMRLKKKCQARLGLAEHIKKMLRNTQISSRGNEVTLAKTAQMSNTVISTTTDQLSTKEQVILLKSSRLNGLIFPPWTSSPGLDDFTLKQGEEKFIDTSELRLSSALSSVFDGWKRPDELFSSSTWHDVEGMATDGPHMEACNPDLIQGATPDCSVVVGLCALTVLPRETRSNLLSSLIYPYETENDRPAMSQNGKYILRLYFNGCFRKVTIDDRLPTITTTKQAPYVIDRANPGLLWPALIEKAYLKIRGGYDFSGSNFGTDFWVLTSWIPEQIFLQSAEISSDEIWQRCYDNFRNGYLAMAIGTGLLTSEEESQYRLISKHDYAVLELREVAGRRLLLVKNPWGGETEPAGLNSIRGGSEDEEEKLSNGLATLNTAGTGRFWMDLDRVMQLFQSIYLNWSPKLFTYGQNVHFTWIVEDSPLESFRNNPQYSLQGSGTGTIWFLLSRHFQTQPAEKSDGDRSSQLEHIGAGLISLYMFQTNQKRVLLSDGALLRGSYVDTPQTLLRADLSTDAAYTVVIAQENLQNTTQSFTLSAFSQCPFILQPAKATYEYWTAQKSAWTSFTAGNNSNSPNYFTNPQFRLSIPSTSSSTSSSPSSSSDIALLLESLEGAVSVHVMILWMRGERATRTTARDIVGHSGGYRRGCALVELRGVEAGEYNVICSTFHAGQRGKFTLHLGSSRPCLLNPLPAEGAGRISTVLPLARFAPGQSRLVLPVTFRRMTRLTLVARPVVVGPRSDNSKTFLPPPFEIRDGITPLMGTASSIKAPLTISLQVEKPGSSQHTAATSFSSITSGSSNKPLETILSSIDNHEEGSGVVVRTQEFDFVPDMYRPPPPPHLDQTHSSAGSMRRTQGVEQGGDDHIRQHHCCHSSAWIVLERVLPLRRIAPSSSLSSTNQLDGVGNLLLEGRQVEEMVQVEMFIDVEFSVDVEDWVSPSE